MPTKQAETREWIERAPKNATHMAVVCDTFEWEDFPVYVVEGEDAHTRLSSYSQRENMTCLMEVYNLKMDIETQLLQGRCYNY